MLTPRRRRPMPSRPRRSTGPGLRRTPRRRHRRHHRRRRTSRYGPMPSSARLCSSGFVPTPGRWWASACCCSCSVGGAAGGAGEAGLAGFSIEDYSGNPDDPIYPLELAAERIEAAVRVAHEGPVRLVLTARAENLLHGRGDLDDTIARLLAYQEAGADV